jgi:hypothetical protein
LLFQNDLFLKHQQAVWQAEVCPEDKCMVVKHLQAAGHVTGMTGDGVNDAPALRQAEYSGPHRNFSAAHVPSCLILDVSLPVLNGLDRAVEDHDPDLRVSLERIDDFLELPDNFRAHHIDRRIVDRDTPIGGRPSGHAIGRWYCPYFRIDYSVSCLRHMAFHAASPEGRSVKETYFPNRYEDIADTIVQLSYSLQSGLIAAVRDAR